MFPRVGSVPAKSHKDWIVLERSHHNERRVARFLFAENLFAFPFCVSFLRPPWARLPEYPALIPTPANRGHCGVVRLW